MSETLEEAVKRDPQWAADEIRRLHAMAQPLPSAGGNSKWHRWPGGSCPVDQDAVVEVEFRNGERHTGAGRAWLWKHQGEVDDIVSYRLCTPSNVADKNYVEGLELRYQLACNGRREAEQALALERGYLVSCPWCGEQMESRPIGAQMAHVIACGDRKIGEERKRTPSHVGRSFHVCEDHKNAEWNQPELEADACVLCRLFYLEAQESLLEEWQQRALRAEEASAEVKRPLDAQMARLNETVTRLNAENERLRSMQSVIVPIRVTQAMADAVNGLEQWSGFTVDDLQELVDTINSADSGRHDG